MRCWFIGAVALAVASAGTATEALSVEETALLRELGAQAESNLRETILPFWLRHSRDEARGGFHGAIGTDLQVDDDRPRGALLTSRIMWTFSAAYRHEPLPEYREMARWALEDLLRRFWDPEYKGLFWLIATDGTPVDPRKHLYGQVFGIYALSEYHRAFGDPRAAAHAFALRKLIETHARDREHGGYFEELDRTWKRREDLSPRVRLLGGSAPKSQNTHLHVMEAYTNLVRIWPQEAWPDDELREDLRSLVDLMLSRVLNPADHHLHLFLADDWTPRSAEISYGHDIEFSWLICETAQVLGDADLLARAQREAVAIADVCLREGVDADGGMFNEETPGGIRDANKDWWQQAEAAVGFLNAWQISREPRFLEAARQSWTFIDRSLVNRAGGEWFRSADRAGRPDTRSPLADLWKCPYHNGRACLETIARARATLAQ